MPEVTLSRLTTPPPDEIAGLTGRLKKAATAPSWTWSGIAALLEEAAAKIRALAQENERLKELSEQLGANVTLRRAEKAEARIRQLEGIVAQIQPPNDIGDNCTAELAVKCASLEQRIRELEAGREALMAAAKALHDLIIGSNKKGCISRGHDALAALRAASIQME